MIINVIRYGNGLDSTAGLLLVDGVHVGYTCEDQCQPEGTKIQDETCIPVGMYELKLRGAGRMHKRYQEKYSFHRGMLHLQNVPGFDWIYIHVGNTDDHTSGCILVGQSTVMMRDGEYTVGSSVLAYTALCDAVHTAIDRGEQIWVEVS